jgi:hypothetical protein
LPGFSFLVKIKYEVIGKIAEQRIGDKHYHEHFIDWGGRRSVIDFAEPMDKKGHPEFDRRIQHKTVK